MKLKKKTSHRLHARFTAASACAFNFSLCIGDDVLSDSACGMCLYVCVSVGVLKVFFLFEYMFLFNPNRKYLIEYVYQCEFGDVSTVCFTHTCV